VCKSKIEFLLFLNKKIEGCLVIKIVILPTRIFHVFVEIEYLELLAHQQIDEIIPILLT